MSMKLRELIRQVRACKTAAEERAVIAKECALIRSAIKDEDATYRHRNVAKLIYISMLGHPTHFGQMETLKLIASPKYSDKRIGYLGMALLIEDTNDVLTLVTNSLTNDLNSPYPYVCGLALNTLTNVGSGEMLRDLSTSLSRMLEIGQPFTVKKALLCVGRLLEYDAEMLPDFWERMQSLLSDPNHATQICATQALIRFAQNLKPSERKQIRKVVPVIVKALTKLTQTGYSPEYDVAGHNDPHLQVALLRLLRLLGEDHPAASAYMSDVLAQVATNTDNAKNAGNAILNEVVRTIMGIEAEANLRVLAVNILGKFLTNKDTNIRYVALASLEKLVVVDTPAVQRHRATILACLKDLDVSIRNRALENIFHLMEEANVEEMCREVVAYLGVAPKDQRRDLASRIADVADRFPISRRWHVETLLDVLAVAGSDAPRRVWRLAVALVGSTTGAEGQALKAYVVHRLFSVVAKEADEQSETQQGQTCAALFAIGEFGDLLLREPPATCAEAGFAAKRRTKQEVLQALDRLQRAHDADSETKAMGLTAMIKLRVRFAGEGGEDAKWEAALAEVVGQYKTSMDLELQARSFEFSKILEMENDTNLSTILDAMPMHSIEDLRRLKARKQGDGRNSASPTPRPQEELNLLDGPVAAAPTESAAPSAKSATAGIDLEDLFGGNSNSSAGNNSSAVAASTTQIVVAHDVHPMHLALHFDAPVTQPGGATAMAVFTAREPLTDVVLQIAVPKYMTTKLSAASGSSLSPGQTITQRVEFTNPTPDKPYMLKFKLSYTSASAGQVVTQGTVSEFPAPRAGSGSPPPSVPVADLLG